MTAGTTSGIFPDLLMDLFRQAVSTMQGELKNSPLEQLTEILNSIIAYLVVTQRFFLAPAPAPVSTLVHRVQP